MVVTDFVPLKNAVNNSTIEQVVRVTVECDSIADLPAMNYTTTTSGTLSFAQGSRAHIIEDNTWYMLKGDGTWVLQVPESQAYTYTKAEIDTMLGAIEDTIYVHDSIQVNLNDITWTQSGGGLYYSQTIQLPDINLLYSVCLSGFASLRATDVIQAACRRSGGWSGFVLYANTNSFNSGAWVTVSGIGTRSVQP